MGHTQNKDKDDYKTYGTLNPTKQMQAVAKHNRFTTADDDDTF